MTKETLIKKFFQELERENYDEVVKFFTPQGKIHSPMYGTMNASAFYHKLPSDVSPKKFEIQHFFLDKDHPHVAATHITSTWQSKGKAFHLEGVNIFEFNSDDTKIQSIKIFYDTYPIRHEFKSTAGK